MYVRNEFSITMNSINILYSTYIFIYYIESIYNSQEQEPKKA